MMVHLIEEETEAILADPSLQAIARVLLLALTRADEEGVVRFDKDELPRLLSAPTKGSRDRTPVPFTAAGIQWLLNSCVKRGLFAPGSTQEEVVLTFAYRAQTDSEGDVAA